MAMTMTTITITMTMKTTTAMTITMFPLNLCLLVISLFCQLTRNGLVQPGYSQQQCAYRQQTNAAEYIYIHGLMSACGATWSCHFVSRSEASRIFFFSCNVQHISHLHCTCPIASPINLQSIHLQLGGLMQPTNPVPMNPLQQIHIHYIRLLLDML